MEPYSQVKDLLPSGTQISMRRFSGLHAHMVLFLAITNIGDTVLLLPEIVEDNTSTKSILERLGLNIYECVVDYENMKIDIEKTKRLIEDAKPKFIFVNSSEIFNYENFSWLNEYESIYKIYDASQYLLTTKANDCIKPFVMSFNAIISTLGPRQILFCTKTLDRYWDLFNSNISTYVSKPQIYSV